MEFDCCFDLSCTGRETASVQQETVGTTPTQNLECCIKPQWSNIKKCKPHTHKNWEIILNLEGDVTSVIGGIAYHIHPGDIMVIPPEVVHDGTSAEGYTDMFLRAETLDFTDIVVVQDYDGAVKELMELLQRLMTEQRENISGLADSLLDSICRYIRHYTQTGSGHAAVRMLKKLLFDHRSDTDFQLSRAMESLEFDKDYLRRCFKKEVGRTPHEYLINLRIEHAKSLLVQYNFTSVEDVAAACGFADSFYFSTCFKRHIGMPPLQYRKKFLG